MYNNTLNLITVTWSASCPVINEAIGYRLTVKDLTTNKTSTNQLLGMVLHKMSKITIFGHKHFLHNINKNLKFLQKKVLQNLLILGME